MHSCKRGGAGGMLVYWLLAGCVTELEWKLLWNALQLCYHIKVSPSSTRQKHCIHLIHHHHWLLQKLTEFGGHFLFLILVWQGCHMSTCGLIKTWRDEQSFCQWWFSHSPAPPAVLWTNECNCAVSCTWASTRRCLIRVMDFCSVSFSGGIKACSSSSRGLGPATMKFAIWSFRLFRDCTARGKHTNINQGCKRTEHLFNLGVYLVIKNMIH